MTSAPSENALQVDPAEQHGGQDDGERQQHRDPDH
jgi:hypothetical protein